MTARTGRALIALVLAVGVAAVVTARAAPLAPYEWRYRPILVFAPSSDDVRLKEQAKRLRSAVAALKERDMIVLTVAGAGPILAEQAAPPQSDASSLRRAFGIETQDFTVVLVGKDGGEKFRSQAVVDPRDLVDLVNEIAPRREEVKRKRS
jgi:Domain of unknown function (DUF4174)